jgi:predicted O-methyltransferase YrrM
MDGSDDPELGVWSTDRDCYVLLADHVIAGARTLETGSGLSTVVLAAAGARHTCVTPAQAEADRILAYCADHDIETGLLNFEIGCSDEVLPRVSQQPLDLVLIDGNHGFPTPMLDWYYAGSSLRAGGLLVIDDIQLPAVAHLCSFVDRDPRWATLRRTAKWVAYRRLNEGDLRQDWFEQPFYSAASGGRLVTRAVRKFRRLLRPRGQLSHRT